VLAGFGRVWMSLFHFKSEISVRNDSENIKRAMTRSPRRRKELQKRQTQLPLKFHTKWTVLTAADHDSLTTAKGISIRIAVWIHRKRVQIASREDFSCGISFKTTNVNESGHGKKQGNTNRRTSQTHSGDQIISQTELH
jgi:hypothetical protein